MSIFGDFWWNSRVCFGIFEKKNDSRSPAIYYQSLKKGRNSTNFEQNKPKNYFYKKSEPFCVVKPPTFQRETRGASSIDANMVRETPKKMNNSYENLLGFYLLCTSFPSKSILQTYKCSKMTKILGLVNKKFFVCQNVSRNRGGKA